MSPGRPGGTAAAAGIAVIGGGPAGAACCVALARLGQRPLWIAPPLPVRARIGESLAPAANVVLARVGLLEVAGIPPHRRANASFSAWGSDRLVERSAIVQLEGPGLVLDRAAFDEALRQAAAARGIQPLPIPLRAAEREQGHWRLTLADGSVHHATFLLDCSGRKAAIGRRLARRHRADKLVATYSFLPQVDPDVEPTPATLVEAAADGWWYAALLPARAVERPRLLIAHFTDLDLMPPGLKHDPAAWARLVGNTRYVSRWIGSGGFALEGAPERTSAATSWLEPVAGLDADSAGWAAVGDAAAAFDPLSSHGLVTALWSAEAAAKAAVAALHRDPLPLGRYAAAVAEGIADFRQRHQEVYGSESRFSEAPFWRRRRSPQALPGE